MSCGICESICTSTILEFVNHFLYGLTDDDIVNKIMLDICQKKIMLDIIFFFIHQYLSIKLLSMIIYPIMQFRF